MKLRNREEFKDIHTCPGFVRLKYRGTWYQFNLLNLSYFPDEFLSVKDWNVCKGTEAFERLINPENKPEVIFTHGDHRFIFEFEQEPSILNPAYDPAIAENLNNKAALLDKLEDGKIQNEQGGKESNILMRYDLLPPLAITEISRAIKTGAETYGVDNWRKLSVATNINHALYHLVMYLVKPNLKDLTHAGCRILFVIELYIKEHGNANPSRDIR